MQKNNAFKYIVTLFITILLFSTAFYLSNYFNTKKTQSIKDIEDEIAIDLLSSETQFDILKQSSCTQLDSSILAEELGELGSKLSSTETQIGTNNAEIIRLKKYYSILQIKHYLLMSAFEKECNKKPVTIVYFYSADCEECDKQGYVLTYLRDTYPGLRTYSLDYNLDLSAVKTLISLNKIPPVMPALIINNKLYSGFTSTEDIEKVIKPLLPPPVATSTATSTKAR